MKIISCVVKGVISKKTHYEAKGARGESNKAEIDFLGGSIKVPIKPDFPNPDGQEREYQLTLEYSPIAQKSFDNSGAYNIDYYKPILLEVAPSAAKK